MSEYFSSRVRSPPNTSSAVTSPTQSFNGFNTPGLTTPGGGTAKGNAVQARIATVLSASYSDLDIREVLGHLDDKTVRNTPETRRNLRLEVQQELIQCNGQVITDFGNVAGQLKRVGAAIDALNKSCAAIRAHVAAANRETAPVLEESTAMTTQKQQTETKQKLLTAFNTHFQLSDAELSALTSSAEPVTEVFFAALVRVKQIHNDSQLLLGSEDQQLGLEILEQSSKQLNAAFQKLFRWTQRELKVVDLENPQLSSGVRRALRVLAERPALFQSCLDFFAETREHTLSDSFYAALTGTSAGTGQAMELNAHDPLRYVSDMLAWVHAATVGEHEALQNLFVSDADEISRNIKASHESQPWLSMSDATEGEAVGSDGVFDGKQALSSLVDRDLSGVMRQLRQRIEQIVQGHEDATLAFQVSNLVTFYSNIFTSLLSRQSSLVGALQPIADLAMEQFRATTRDMIANLDGDVTAAPSDLSPPYFLEEALRTLKKLMRSYDTSVANASSLDERTLGFRAILAEALDPYLDGCESMAKHMSSPDTQIFALNCLLATKSAVRGSAYTTERVAEIDDHIEGQKQRLVQVLHSWFVSESGMGPLIEALQPFMDASTTSELRTVAQLAALNHDVLSETARHLDAFLPTAMEDARAFIGRLNDKTLPRQICEEAADLFGDDFEGVERLLVAVDDVQNGSNSADQEGDMRPLVRDSFPRTSDEIKVLLS